MERETFEEIAVRVVAEHGRKTETEGWISVDGKSETQRIWLVIDAIIKELDRRAKL
jgi:hypothetical protein